MCTFASEARAWHLSILLVSKCIFECQHVGMQVLTKRLSHINDSLQRKVPSFSYVTSTPVRRGLLYIFSG